MSTPETVLIGHSHCYAILSAYDMAAWERTGPVRIHRFFLMDEEYQPTLLLGERLNPELLRRLSETLSSRPVCAAFLSVDGNAHTVFALVKHPRPFDFVLSELPDLPLDETAEVVPEAFVRAALHERLGMTERIMAALRRSVNVPLYHIESVPPVPSDGHILQTQEPIFWETLRLDELGVAPASLRFKLWRLHSELVGAICRRHDIGFVAAPAETQDKDGFMAEQAWFPRDATHGNQWYGSRVLRQIAAIAGVSEDVTAPTEVQC